MKVYIEIKQAEAEASVPIAFRGYQHPMALVGVISGWSAIRTLLSLDIVLREPQLRHAVGVDDTLHIRVAELIAFSTNIFGL